MERLTRPLNLILCGLGVLLVLWFTPASGWTLRNLIDVARFGAVHEDYNSTMSLGLLPNNLASAEHFPPRGTRAYEAAQFIDHGHVPEADAYAQKYGDAASLAQDLRVHFRSARPGSKTNDPRSMDTQKALATAGLDIADRGHAVDPDNGFFILAQAFYQLALGDRDAAWRSVRLAATTSKYDDYLTDDARLLGEAYTDRWGYRGELATVVQLSSLTMPHLSDFKGLAKELLDQPVPARDRFAILQVGNLLVTHGNTMIDGLVGVAIGSIALHEPGYKVKDSEWEAYYTRRAAELEASLRQSGDLPSPGPIELEHRLIAYRQGAQTTMKQSGTGDILGVSGVNLTIAAGAFGLAIAFVCLLVGPGIYLAFPTTAKNAYPYALALATLIFPIVTGLAGPLVTIVLGVAGCCAIFIPSTIGKWGLATGAAVLLFLTAPATAAAGPVAILAGCLFADAKPSARIWIPLTIIGVCVGLNSGWGLLHQANQEDNGPTILILVLAFGCLYGTIPVARMDLKRYASQAFFAATLCLLIGVSFELRFNEQLRPYTRHWMSEGLQVRRNAGLAP